MKKIYLLLGSLIALVSSCMSVDHNGFGGWNEKIQGTGKVISQQRDVHGFSKIKASNALSVIITQGQSDSVVVEANENLLEHIFTEIDGDCLRIYTDANFNSGAVKTVKVTYKSINGLDASSAASIISKSKINSSTLEISTSSASTITAEIETKETKVDASSASTSNIFGKTAFLTLKASSAATINGNGLSCGQVDADASSAASINIDGSTGIFTASTSSGASINASNLAADDGDLTASSGGSIRAKVLKIVKTEASSGGSVQYQGSPKVRKQNASSGGNIESKEY